MTPEIRDQARSRATSVWGERAAALPDAMLLGFLNPEEQPLASPVASAESDVPLPEPVAERLREMQRAHLRDAPLPPVPDMDQTVVSLTLRGWEKLEAVMLRGFDVIVALHERFQEAPELREALVRYAPQNDMLVRLVVDLWTRYKMPGATAVRSAAWFWNALATTLRTAALVEGLPLIGTLEQALQALRQMYRLAARVFAPPTAAILA